MLMGMEIALRGLYASQRGMANVSHNVDNTNTPGYSRQVINQVASRPMLMAGSVGMLGMGTDVTSVDRVRDTFLDEKYWSESKYMGEWSVKATVLEELQTIYNEPSQTGYTKIINDFYDALQSLSTDPSSESVRALVMEKGKTVAKYFNSVAKHFDNLQEDLNNMVNAKVEEVNQLADQIKELNLQIYNFEVVGNKANDLRDRRGYLVDKLSAIVNCNVYETETGLKLPNGEPEKRFSVSISGKALVDHGNVVHIKCESRTTNLNSEDIDHLYALSWEDGNKLNIKSGELKGYLDMRDGNDGQNGSPDAKGIPYYQRKMNEFVQTFAMAFNEGIMDTNGDRVSDKTNGHVDGYTLTGTAPSQLRFFTLLGDDGKPMASGDFYDQLLAYAAKNGVVDDPSTEVDERIQEGYKLLNARNFSISFDIEDDPSNNIAASSTAGQAGNNENLAILMKMRHNAYMFKEGTPEDFIKTVISTLGVDGQQYEQYMEIQEGIMNQIETRRQSVSGVSLNEEMTNLVKYQQIYAASAKMVQSFGELMDILINRMGI